MSNDPGSGIFMNIENYRKFFCSLFLETNKSDFQFEEEVVELEEEEEEEEEQLQEEEEQLQEKDKEQWLSCSSQKGASIKQKNDENEKQQHEKKKRTDLLLKISNDQDDDDDNQNDVGSSKCCPSSQKHNMTDEILTIDDGPSTSSSDHVTTNKLSTFLKSFSEAVKVHKLLHERKNGFCGNCEIQEADIFEMSRDALDLASLADRSTAHKPHESHKPHKSNDEIFNSELTAVDYMVRYWPKQKLLASPKGRTSLPASYETLFSKMKKNQKRLKNLEVETAFAKKIRFPTSLQLQF
jgi:hypothetical protein